MTRPPFQRPPLPDTRYARWGLQYYVRNFTWRTRKKVISLMIQELKEARENRDFLHERISQISISLISCTDPFELAHLMSTLKTVQFQFSSICEYVLYLNLWIQYFQVLCFV